MSSPPYRSPYIPERELLKIFSPECREIIETKLQETEADIADRPARGIKWLTFSLRHNPQYRLLWEVMYEMSFSTKDLERTRARLLRLKNLRKRKKPGTIHDADIAEAKRVPIEKFLTGKMRCAGNRIYALCPFKDERNASFVIYTDQNSWHCFSCGEGGDVISFIQLKEKLAFVDAVKFLLQ